MKNINFYINVGADRKKLHSLEKCLSIFDRFSKSQGDYLRILTGKTHPQVKLKWLQKKMNMDILVIDTLSQLFIRGPYTLIKI